MSTQNEHVYDLPEAAMVPGVSYKNPVYSSKIPVSYWLKIPREARQDCAYRDYRDGVFNAGQTLDRIEMLQIWPRAGESDWAAFVARLQAIADAEPSKAAGGANV